MPTSFMPAFLCLTLSTTLAVAVNAQPAPDATRMLDLLSPGHAAGQIIRSDNADRLERQAATLLRNALQARGAKLPIVTDAAENAAAETEIVIGQTNRETLAGVVFNRVALGHEGFRIKAVGRRLFILGGGEAGTKKGIQFLLRTFIPAGQPDQPAGTAATLAIPADYDYAEPQKYALSDIQIAGHSLADFAIIPPADDPKPALLLRRLVFQHAAIWLEIAAPETPKKPAIVFSEQKPEAAGSFEWLIQGGEVILKTDLAAGFVRGLHAFFAGVVSRRQDVLSLPEGYAHRQTFGPVVLYRDFGARGDGRTDDAEAIRQAHAFANQLNLPVKADQDATYYLGGADNTAVIQTDTDFGNAEFLIDDTSVENRGSHVFLIRSKLEPHKLDGVTSLQRRQANLGITLPRRSLACATNNHVKRYIRYGANQNNGSPQTDVFIVEANGDVDPMTPILWDFDRLTDLTVYPIDETPLKITGGRFTTKANEHESRYAYYGRAMAIMRSNVLIDGLKHDVIGEGDQGAPYGGFISISRCADVTVRNTVLTGHKTYRTIGAAGKPVSMGTYDIGVNRAVNVSFVNCRQSNDINDRTYWGIMGSNYCKNLLYDGCSFSRFDAHMGVANATIRNSTLGHSGINAIGTGTLLVENSTVNGYTLVSLRSDYGSTWEGDFIIRNCVFIPAAGQKISASLFGGHYTGQHDFGYTCHMPETITIDGLHIDDRNHPENYQGPAIFANFNRNNLDNSYVEKHPYVKTREVILNNVSTASGLPLRTSDNSHMFKDVKITFLKQE
jgi:hypothetical protein